jgi:hypothetical protein
MDSPPGRRSEPMAEQIGRTGFKGVKLKKTHAFIEVLAV